LFERETQKIIGEKIDYSSWQEGFLKAIDFAYKNQQGIYHLYQSISREPLEHYLYNVTYNNMSSFVKVEASDLKVSDDDLDLVAKIYSHALVGLVLEWINDGMRVDPKDSIARLGVLFDGNIRFCFEKNKYDTDN